MPFFIPLVLGASTTGYFWYNSEQDKEEDSSFSDELFKIAIPLLSIIAVLLFFRWLYNKGSIQNSKT